MPPCSVRGVGAILSRNAKPRSLRYDGGAVIGSRLNSDASLEVFLLLWQVSRCLIMYQGVRCGPMWSDMVISHTPGNVTRQSEPLCLPSSDCAMKSVRLMLL